MIYVFGSVCYDHILRFRGTFGLMTFGGDALNFSLVCDEWDRQIGGTGSNISYNLRLLGEVARTISSVGRDGDILFSELSRRGVDVEGISIQEGTTAKAVMVTDEVGNQLSFFFPGVLDSVVELVYRGVEIGDASLAIISAGSPRSIRFAVKMCLEKSVPFVYNPGQSIGHLDTEELLEGIAGARVLIVNELELRQIEERTGLSKERIVHRKDLLVAWTLGARGAILQEDGKEIFIPAIDVNMSDPTGAGDAFCAGLTKGLVNGVELRIMGQIAALAAAYSVESRGTLGHHFKWVDFRERYGKCFGEDLSLE